ncbi:DUF7739 domain-containing protein [Streptomyces sp. DW26H14]|uniref:DUF7739 domain-containing protein n=1 Tax=Streptomyces sp. DW26H14 TaxID=3435395 RepID=UPI00403D7E1E
MGWNVSHGSNQNGEERRSYTSVYNFAQQLAHVLSAREWKELAPIFNRQGPADPFDVPPRQAARVADLLDKAAGHRKMPSDWADMARLFAAAARRASQAGQMWEWS